MASPLKSRFWTDFSACINGNKIEPGGIPAQVLSPGKVRVSCDGRAVRVDLALG